MSRGQTLRDRYFTSQTGGVLFRSGCHRDKPAILFSLGIGARATPVIALAVPRLSRGRAAEDNFGLSLVSTKPTTCLIFICGSVFERKPSQILCASKGLFVWCIPFSGAAKPFCAQSQQRDSVYGHLSHFPRVQRPRVVMAMAPCPIALRPSP